ncbi:unnamed protein product [Rotaria sordida]|uniref:FLYWCH-type domain-containing protein n=1 Tax=Rotaria sordida TaxID=392033 RepID=A0A815SR43_9BILA|nr:unnamed protein product [Rotaria sordida]CAF1653740.1 unnamed protein product [Rotaria sordida]
MNDKSIEFTTTNRNGLVLHYQGYQYTFKRKYKNTNEWRCRRRPCTTSISLCWDNRSIIREPDQHTCGSSSPENIIVEKAVSRMRQRAAVETLPISQIYSQEVVKTLIDNPDLDTGSIFPLLDSIDSTLYRQRAKNYPNIPKNIHDLMIPDVWKVGSHGEPFLLVDEICLALIPRHLVEKTWTEAMDEYTPNHVASIKFNDYMVSTYVDCISSRFRLNLWNVNDALVNNIPRTNNHVEGYNNRLGSLFPVHPHIFRFIELLRHEHFFQHHHAEQSKSYLPKRPKSSENINIKLIDLLDQHSNGELTDLELALHCGKIVKTKLVKKYK